MEDTLISVETAILAKEKGFNVPIQHTVNNINQVCDENGKKLSLSNVIADWNKFEDIYSKPTQSLLQK